MTTCIHNLFSGSDRWADLYGECVIKCRKKWKETSTPAAASAPSAKKERPLSVCQIEFLSGAGSYWSSASKRHEVRGTIKDDKGTAYGWEFQICKIRISNSEFEILNVPLTLMLQICRFFSLLLRGGWFVHLAWKKVEAYI